jgi:hypothetical protein
VSKASGLPLGGQGPGGESDGAALIVRARSLSLTNGKVRAVKRYTADTIDWLAAYDVTSQRCYDVAASELGNGMNTLTLRLSPTRNGQHQGIRFASDYLGFQP